jgi:hypothetical protein
MRFAMLLPAPPVKYRKRPPRIRAAVVVPPVGALVLVSATYEPSAAVYLTFGRAIDIADIDGSGITVDDGILGFRFAGTGGATLVSPTTVELVLIGVEELPFVGTTLNATGANGIVAAGDGASWAGCLDVTLPFG